MLLFWVLEKIDFQVDANPNVSDTYRGGLEIKNGHGKTENSDQNVLKYQYREYNPELKSVGNTTQFVFLLFSNNYN